MMLIEWVSFAAGVLLLALNASSVVNTLLVPRSSTPGATAAIGRGVWRLYRLATDRIRDAARRERLLAPAPAILLLVLLASWLATAIVGYALVLWPFTRNGLVAAFRLSGSSLLTLGFGLRTGTAPSVVAFVAAGTGLTLVALLVTYLPALYAAFNRRETQVTMLEALASSPPWGPELLARHCLAGNLDHLGRLYDRWTSWTADISESHCSYRTLLFFRSPDPATSWLLCLIAVLDAAAMQLAMSPASAPPEALPLLRVGYRTAQQLAESLRIEVPPRNDERALSAVGRQDFDEAIRWLQSAGWKMERDGDQAWSHFRQWRQNYEPASQALAFYLNMPTALWSGDRPSVNPTVARPRHPPLLEPRQPSPELAA